MNNNITDNGTPNNHIIIIRVMNPPFRLLLLENGYDVRVESFLQQTPIHSAASMPLRRQVKFDVDSALYGLLPVAGAASAVRITTVPCKPYLNGAQPIAPHAGP